MHCHLALISCDNPERTEIATSRGRESEHLLACPVMAYAVIRDNDIDLPAKNGTRTEFPGPVSQPVVVVFDHMKAWAYVCKNSNCTNENIPIQSKDIVLEVKDRVDQDFAAYGLQEHQRDEFNKFCEIVLRSARAAKTHKRGKKRKR
ncbi:hypothetical protein B0O99DRAFT_601871 [Bisporella sp. PMI_857]|nr:hypothetical protein B0O99DRAFT_601871 [Bisporella sp. PMI_857]